MLEFSSYLFPHKFARIIYCYLEGDRSDRTMVTINRLKNLYEALEVHEGLPDLKRLNLRGRQAHTLLIMDDLSNKVFASDEMAQLFRNGSSHEVKGSRNHT